MRHIEMKHIAQNIAQKSNYTGNDIYDILVTNFKKYNSIAKTYELLQE